MAVVLLRTIHKVYAAPYSTPQVRLPFLATAPTIDGDISDAAWQGAARMEGMGSGGTLSPQNVSYWVGATPQELCIAVQSETPPGGKLLARVNPVSTGANARADLDDSLEIWLDPLHYLGNDTTGRRKIYQLVTNAKGAIYQQAFNLAGGGEAWRGDWRVGNRVYGDGWTCEIAIPWSSLGVTPADLSHAIGVRVGRNWKQTTLADQTEWSPLGGAYANPDTMPLVSFDPKAPVVQMLSLRDSEGKAPDVKFSVRNPGTAPLQVAYALAVLPKNSAPTRKNATLSLAPGQLQVVDVPATGLIDEEIFTSLDVTSPDEKTTYYSRNFSWSLVRPDTLWTLDPDAAKKINTSFAYYPYYRAMKVKVEMSGLQEKAKVRAVNLAVRPKGSTTPLATTRISSIQNDVAQVDEWKVPDLNEGQYELVVSFDGLKVEPQVLDFVRHKFPWENNALGKADVVLPPFTPISVSGKRVGTILREHTMNGLGLWDQVTSQGVPMLRAPMRLEVRSGGKLTGATGQFKITGQKPTRVTGQAQWTAGALRGATTSEWDYDGVMKSTLTLQPSATPIDSLTLVIPLSDAQSPLMHVCTDGIRFNYAGTTPKGSGVIWDGTKAARNSIVGSYVPYIWLGGQERGVSVFGENDRGWVSDGKTPEQQLVRSADGTLELRFNLIAAPTTLREARTIVLGFQATPVKPMPANWRLWTVGARGKVNPQGSFHQTWLGSGFYWGTVEPAADIYPRDMDYSIFDKFAETRRTGVVDQAFLQKWLAGYHQPDAVSQESRVRHVTSGFDSMKGHPQNVLLYTNARGVRYDTPEGQTFLNEWNRNLFPKREWPYAGHANYDLDPVASYRDYAAWNYKKMYDTFADSLYWDDVFLQSDFNTISSDAYLLPDGNVQPAAGLWNMRALVKRGADFTHEAGKINGNMVHMTNTAIAPILSFAATQASWEDHDGDKDFQDRFSRDYIQAESIGRQFGNVPIVLFLVQGDDEQKLKWARRTGAGVMLTHEVKPWDSNIPDYWSNVDRLREYGYGSPGTQVWNYWQADYPAKVSGGESSSLLVCKPGSAMMVVCDYGSGGSYTVHVDPKAIALAGQMKVTDAESGAPLPVSASGDITFPLKKHDFKVLRIG